MKGSAINKGITLDATFIKTIVKVLKLEHNAHGKTKMNKTEMCLTSLQTQLKSSLKFVE